MPLEFVGIQYGPLTPTKASTFDAPIVMTLTFAFVTDSPGVDEFSPSVVSVDVSRTPDVSGTASCPLFWKERLPVRYTNWEIWMTKCCTDPPMSGAVNVSATWSPEVSVGTW
jgi:hypothetical protein